MNDELKKLYGNQDSTLRELKTLYETLDKAAKILEHQRTIPDLIQDYMNIEYDEDNAKYMAREEYLTKAREALLLLEPIVLGEF